MIMCVSTCTHTHTHTESHSDINFLSSLCISEIENPSLCIPKSAHSLKRREDSYFFYTLYHCISGIKFAKKRKKNRLFLANSNLKEDSKILSFPFYSPLSHSPSLPLPAFPLSLSPKYRSGSRRYQ